MKAYWIKRAKISNAEQFIEYLKTIVPWILSVGGKIIKRSIQQDSELNEWDGGQIGVVIEFESRSAAQKAFYSKEFQEYIKFRGLDSSLSLSIIY